MEDNTPNPSEEKIKKIAEIAIKKVHSGVVKNANMYSLRDWKDVMFILREAKFMLEEPPVEMTLEEFEKLTRQVADEDDDELLESDEEDGGASPFGDD